MFIYKSLGDYDKNKPYTMGDIFTLDGRWACFMVPAVGESQNVWKEGRESSVPDNFKVKDPEAWREENRKKQATGVKFEYLRVGKWECGLHRFDGDKEHYREVPQLKAETHLHVPTTAIKAPCEVSLLGEVPQPTIPHLKERILWLQQREAGTNEVWQQRGINEHCEWFDLMNDREPSWMPNFLFRVKPKTVKYYFALAIGCARTPFTICYTSKDLIIADSKEFDYTIIGNIEEREVEI